MSHIFRELKEIPIPPEAYVNKSDARVFLILRYESGKNKRIVIGRATSATAMHPNENFRYQYPALWEQMFGVKGLKPHKLHCGLYGMGLAIGWSSKLYPLLVDSFGPLYANTAMDYSLFSILDRTNTTELYSERMSHECTFSGVVRSDEWLSRAFRNGFNEDATFEFRKRWLEACSANCKEVWICVDGSNNDCTSAHCDLTEQGAAKSHKEITLVSYIYAVEAESGMPITWFVNNGGMPDCKAINEVVQYLAASGIHVKGLILDRGFCSTETIEQIKEAGYQYILMLKNNTQAYKHMYSHFGESVRWKMDKVINSEGIFGVTGKTGIFANSPEESTVALFFDSVNATARCVTLIRKVLNGLSKVQTQLKMDNKKVPTIPAELGPYLVVSKNGQSEYSVQPCYAAWQKSNDEKGFYAVASSFETNAHEINRLYDLRDRSEKQFSVLKTQLGSKVTRVYERSSIEAKFTIAFVASILRFEIERACFNLGLDTNKMIKEMDRIVIELLPNNVYTPIRNYSKRQLDLLKQIGLDSSVFDQIALQANNEEPVQSQVRTIPVAMPKRGRGRPPKPKTKVEAKVPKKRGGRKKGSKNKKTLLREALLAKLPPQPKRAPGRPKGSKNKKTLERERLLAEQQQKAKRGRGRPKGSLNKKTIERMLLQTNTPPVIRRKRGRPIGSRNKK